MEMNRRDAIKTALGLTVASLLPATPFAATPALAPAAVEPTANYTLRISTADNKLLARLWGSGTPPAGLAKQVLKIEAAGPVLQTGRAHHFHLSCRDDPDFRIEGSVGRDGSGADMPFNSDCFITGGDCRVKLRLDIDWPTFLKGPSARK